MTAVAIGESDGPGHVQTLVLFLIVAALTFGYASERFVLPARIDLLPEILSIIAAAAVILHGAAGGFHRVSGAYWLVLGSIVAVMACGVVVNHMGPGPVFAGLRVYLRAIPFFLLPLVVMFSRRQLETQFKLLMLVALIQFPIAWQQRQATAAIGSTTGDLTTGTILNSGLLTVFLISVACMLTGLYLRRVMPLWKYLLVLALVLAPTTINETKATLVLLPAALLACIYAGSRRGTKLKNALLGVVIVACFFAIFVPVYDSYMKPRWGYGILDFITMEGRVEGYLLKGTDVGEQRQAGRLDGPIVALREITRAPPQAVFGLGVGNASDSALGLKFTGEYYDRYAHMRLSSLAYILLELGLLGTALVIILQVLVLIDSLYVARYGDGALAGHGIAWVGVSIVFLLSLAYHTPHENTALSYFYWFGSGVLCSSRMRLATVPRQVTK